MSASRLTIRVQLQQDHGFSRPLFRKPQPRRWPWLLLLLLLAGAAVLVQQPQWLQSLSAALPKAPAAKPQLPAAAPPASFATGERQDVAATAPPAAAVPAATAEQVSMPVVAEPTPPPASQPQAVPTAVAETALSVAATTVTPAPAASAAVTAEPAAAAAAPIVPVPQAVQAATTGPRVTRQQLTGAINSREPVGQLAATLSAPTVVYFFNELTEMQGEQVRHRWYRNDQLIKERVIKVGAVRWRTWSRHEIDSRSAGAWRVELLDGRGKLLASQQWQVTGSAP